MGRKILLQDGDSRHLLEETDADNEAQLQELLKDNPHLLPIEEFELTGPMMVVGRETTLASGSVDLVGLARSGDVLIIEFKTGPGNADFRHAAAQLLDYGSHLWNMTFEEFESAVALRYFSSDDCPMGSPAWHKNSLQEAAMATWHNLDEDSWISIRQRIGDQLDTGSFRFVLVAQRFRPSIERTLKYLNAVAPSSRFYAIELVRFTGESASAFEARTVIRPEETGRSARDRVALDEQRFLDEVDGDYHDDLEQLFDTCRALDLRFEWGSKGTSIRLSTPDRAEPLSIAWVFPPGGVGWMGLTDLTLGYDFESAKATPSVASALESYVGKVGTIPGAKPAKAKNVEGWTLDPSILKSHLEGIVEAITQLVASVNSVG